MLIDVKMDFNNNNNIKKDQRVNFCGKISIVIRNVIGSENTLIHKAERSGNKGSISCRANKERSNLCPNFVRNTSN